ESYTALKDAEAQLAAIRLDIANTSIRAPFAGKLETLHVEIGDTVRRMEENIATILEYDPFLAVAHIAEQRIQSITLNSPATVTLVNGQVFGGVVRYISSSADPNTRTFRVE